MSSKLLKVRPSAKKDHSCAGCILTVAVIARNALAQEQSQDFNQEYPETIPIVFDDNERSGCAC